MTATRQNIVVTGTSRGIGAATALELARRGFLVGCFARDGALPHSGAGVPADLAPRLVPVKCDVTDDGQLSRAFAAFGERAGGIDGLVNNAGIHAGGASAQFASADFDRILKVNALGVFAACREAYPYLVARGGGTIVNLGSFFAKLGVKGSTAYCASKAAVGAITRCLAAEWGKQGIRVLDIAPGYIETDVNREYLADPVGAERIRRRTFVGRAGSAEEVARLIAAIFAEQIGFLTGETIYVDGGQGIAL